MPGTSWRNNLTSVTATGSPGFQSTQSSRNPTLLQVQPPRTFGQGLQILNGEWGRVFPLWEEETHDVSVPNSGKLQRGHPKPITRGRTPGTKCSATGDPWSARAHLPDKHYQGCLCPWKIKQPSCPFALGLRNILPSGRQGLVQWRIWNCWDQWNWLMQMVRAWHPLMIPRSLKTVILCNAYEGQDIKAVAEHWPGWQRWPIGWEWGEMLHSIAGFVWNARSQSLLPASPPPCNQC